MPAIRSPPANSDSRTALSQEHGRGAKVRRSGGATREENRSALIRRYTPDSRSSFGLHLRTSALAVAGDDRRSGLDGSRLRPRTEAPVPLQTRADWKPSRERAAWA